MATEEPQPAFEETTIPHERALGYRVVFADGALIRTQKQDVLLTFYHDDARVRSEKAEVMKESEGSSRVRPLGQFTQELIRSHEVTVRMNIDDAVGLLSALLTRLSKEAPELLKEKGFEVTSQEGSK